MLRFTFVAVVGLTGLTVLPVVRAVSQEPPASPTSPGQKEVAPAQRPEQVPAPLVPGAGGSPGLEVLAEILGRAAPKLEPAELAGLAPGSNPAVLSLEQAYLLTLIRARNPAGLLAIARPNLVDHAALDAEAARIGALDFDRFRRDFLSGGFHDPAPLFFATLKHRQAVDSARDRVTLTGDIRLLFDELLRGESSGVSQLELELVDYNLLLSRQDLDDEMSSYRSAVDELKVSLGLPPSAAIVLDERFLQPFRNAFSNIDTWQHNPKRTLEMLGKLYNRFPRLDDVTIGGRSLAQVADGKIPEADFLLACTEVAGKGRTFPKDAQAERDARNTLDLRIRQLARGLIVTHKNYQVQRRALELAVREVDQRFERIVSPPRSGGATLVQSANVATQTAGVLQAQSRLYRGRADLVSQWLQFKEQSLELYRELGSMPYDNWEAFHRTFLPVSDKDEAAP